MSDPKTYTFVISDETVNSYGFRVLTDGIDLSLFDKNPIALWVHKRMWGLKEEVLPIGRWENIRKEGGKLLGDLVFDDDDEFAVKLRNKVDKKIINMVSPGLRPVSWSDDPKDLIKGQTRSTLTKCMLREVSLVDIGSNGNALRLFDESGDEVNLSDKGNLEFIPLLDINKPDDMKFQTQIAQVLKLSDGVSEADILAAATTAANDAVKLTDLNTQVVNLTAERDGLKSDLKKYQDAETAANEQKRIDLVDGAIASKKITADEKEDWLALAEQNYELAEKQLGKLEGVKEPELGGEGEVQLSAWDARMNEIDENLKK